MLFELRSLVLIYWLSNALRGPQCASCFLLWIHCNSATGIFSVTRLFSNAGEQDRRESHHQKTSENSYRGRFSGISSENQHMKHREQSSWRPTRSCPTWSTARGGSSTSLNILSLGTVCGIPCRHSSATH